MENGNCACDLEDVGGAKRCHLRIQPCCAEICARLSAGCGVILTRGCDKFLAAASTICTNGKRLPEMNRIFVKECGIALEGNGCLCIIPLVINSKILPERARTKTPGRRSAARRPCRERCSKKARRSKCLPESEFGRTVPDARTRTLPKHEYEAVGPDRRAADSPLKIRPRLHRLPSAAEKPDANRNPAS